MKPTIINYRFLATTLLVLVCKTMTTSAQTSGDDTTGNDVLQEVRKYFNSDNEGAFYIAAERYRDYHLKTGNLHLYYKGWEHEILYDVNHNHFYRAMRKTTTMHNDMKRRKAEDEYYSATHLRGIIYSLKGNITLAHQYFERALEEVDHSQPVNLINIYLDLANIEMDTQPQEAMKHLDCAIDIIKANNGRYEYSDAIGFKVIVNNRFQGQIYENQIFQPLHSGMRLKAYVDHVREDGKIDLTLHQSGRQHTLDFAEVLLRYLYENDGYCNLGDKSPAELIYDRFQVSKKAFKKAIGDLYKRRLITIEEDGNGIRLA